MLLRSFSLLLGAAFVVSPAAASDYSNLCRSADGFYQMDDGSLSRVADDGSSGPEIPFKMLREIELSHENGYCLTRSGKRYDHQVKSYTQRVSFSDDGRTLEIDMVCELIADGMPANETCDRDVITSSTKGTGGTPPSPEPPPVASSNIWSHNGSVLRLIAKGERRTFVYENPRTGMRAAGAKRGAVVFEGTRDGDTYSGTAYIFKKGCDPQGYPVTGEVSSGERRITLYGQKPKIAANCRIERYVDDTLVFDLDAE
jgi:hypothetical protein